MPLKNIAPSILVIPLCFMSASLRAETLSMEVSTSEMSSQPRSEQCTACNEVLNDLEYFYKVECGKTIDREATKSTDKNYIYLLASDLIDQSGNEGFYNFNYSKLTCDGRVPST